VPTLVHDPPPVELERLIERRRRLGLDHLDEVWDGVLHMNPPPHSRHGRVLARLLSLLAPHAQAAGLEAIAEFGIGETDNYRVPDAGLLRPGPDRQYHDTAALATEVVSPGDESRHKFDFYAAHRVDEMLIVDPLKRSVEWFGLAGAPYEPIARSGLIELGADELAQKLEWPED
jgi:Uma2 family endonuclease